MSSVNEVQALLRFLSQDARVPVPLAMSKIKDLKKCSLTTPDTLSKTSLPTIQSLFPDEKYARQILSAAKRVSKKRTSSSTPATISSPSKRSKKQFTSSDGAETLSPIAFEASLALPIMAPSSTDLEPEICTTTLHTNRAPLVVAFVVQLLKYTMPTQPLSSRLSLAQAVMSMGARNKAVSLGIQSETSAEKEGWGEGQPVVRVMGREIRVLRRWGYEWDEEKGENASAQTDIKKEDEAKEDGNRTRTPTEEEEESQQTLKADPSPPGPQQKEAKPSPSSEPPLWALNLETLRSSNSSPLIASPNTASPTGLPIYDPQAARNYLLKSFASSPPSEASSSAPKKEKKKHPAALQEEKEHNLALLLHALDLLYASWVDVLGVQELDRRAWGWYVRVRPDVEDGPRGWGGKGNVDLGKILELRR